MTFRLALTITGETLLTIAFQNGAFLSDKKS